MPQIDEHSSYQAQNPSSIQSMFGGIAKKYDLANSILSLGIHKIWKKKLIKESKVQPHFSILDCATGTGDLAFLFEKKVSHLGKVVATDFCEPMLTVARQKASDRLSSVEFKWADVLNLPFENQSFDITSISFGIRNTQNTEKAIFELGRVTKPNGKVLILEFGQPKNKLMKNLFNFYSHQILPRLGGLLSGNKKAYQYLESSSAHYPCGEDFLKIAKNTNHFSKMKYFSFQSGIAYLYCLEKKN